MRLVRCETKQQPQGCHCTASLKASAGQLQRRRFANGVSTQASSAERRSTRAAGESLAMAARSVALSVFLLAVPLIPSAVASAEEGLLTCLQHQQGNSGLECHGVLQLENCSLDGVSVSWNISEPVLQVAVEFECQTHAQNNNGGGGSVTSVINGTLYSGNSSEGSALLNSTAAAIPQASVSSDWTNCSLHACYSSLGNSTNGTSHDLCGLESLSCLIEGTSLPNIQSNYSRTELMVATSHSLLSQSASEFTAVSVSMATPSGIGSAVSMSTHPLFLSRTVQAQSTDINDFTTAIAPSATMVTHSSVSTLLPILSTSMVLDNLHSSLYSQKPAPVSSTVSSSVTLRTEQVSSSQVSQTVHTPVPNVFSKDSMSPTPETEFGGEEEVRGLFVELIIVIAGLILLTCIALSAMVVICYQHSKQGHNSSLVFESPLVYENTAIRHTDE